MNNTAKKTEQTCRSRLFNPTKSFLSILLDDKNQENFCLYREGRNNDGILYQKTKSDRGNKEEYSYNQYKYDHSNSAVTMTHLDGRQLNKNEQKTYSLQNINPNELAEQMSFHQNIEDAIKAARLSAKWEQLKPNSSFESDVKWGFFNGNEAKTHSSLNSALAEFSNFFQSEAFPPIFCHSINLNEGRDQLHVKLQGTPSLIYNISKLDGDLVTLTIDTLNGVRRIVDNEIPEETFVCSLETLATLKAQINQGLINNLVDINDFLNPYLTPTKSEIQQKRFNYDQIVEDYENDLPPGFCSFNNYNDLYTIRTHPGDNLTFSLNEKNQIVFKSKEDQPWIVGNLRGKNIKTINKANLPKIIFYLSQNLLEAKKRFGSDENQVLTPMDYLEKIDFTNLTLHNLPEFQNLLKDTRIPHGFCKEIKYEGGSFWIIKAGGFFQDKDELLYFQSLKGEKAIACLNPSSNEFEEFTLLDKNNEIVSINDKTIPLLEKIIFERATQQSNLNEGFIPLTLGNFEFIPSNIPSKPNLPSV